MRAAAANRTWLIRAAGPGTWSLAIPANQPFTMYATSSSWPMSRRVGLWAPGSQEVLVVGKHKMEDSWVAITYSAANRQFATAMEPNTAAAVVCGVRTPGGVGVYASTGKTGWQDLASLPSIPVSNQLIVDAGVIRAELWAGAHTAAERAVHMVRLALLL